MKLSGVYIFREYERKMSSRSRPRPRILGCFPFVRTGQPDHYQTSYFDNEIGFFQGFLLKNHLLPAHYIGFDWSNWIVLINSAILITKERVWLAGSDKWKSPLSSLLPHPMHPASRVFLSLARVWLPRSLLFSSSLKKTKGSSSRMVHLMLPWYLEGFDRQGSEQLGCKLINTRKWIGATEIAAVLRSLQIR